MSFVRKRARDEIKLPVELGKKMTQLLETTVDYLLGEVIEADAFKDPIMLKRLQDINTLADNDKHYILYSKQLHFLEKR